MNEGWTREPLAYGATTRVMVAQEADADISSPQGNNAGQEENEDGGSDNHHHNDDAPLSFQEDEPRPLYFRHVPWLFRFDHGPLEATGLALDMYGRAALLMSSIFLGPALLQLANEAAGCVEEQDQEDSCDNRVYHMKPSSLLTNIAIASGLVGTVILPLFGAIVDKTPFRKQVGICSAVVVTVVKGAETMVSSETWFFVAWLQVLSGALYYIHTCATYAYTCELSSCPVEQTKYNSYFFVVMYVSTLIFLFKVLVLSYVLDVDDVGTARISQIITFITAALSFAAAWRWFFRDRPALSSVPDGESLLSCGFRKLLTSAHHIWFHLPALKWLMPSIMCSEAATAALVTVATTYMSDVLEMDANEIGVVFFVVLAVGAPGAKLGEFLGIRYNPVASAKLCVVCFIVTTTVAATVLTGPEDKRFMWMFGAFWGLELGWLHPMHTVIWISLVPKKSESEFMGLYLFCGQALSWLPPLLFTTLNESGLDMAFGLASLNVFFGAGLLFLFCMGNYGNALHELRVAEHSEPGETESNSVGDVSLPAVS